MVLERGENFTTQDLIKEADVALQTFYRHFGSKDQILLAVVGDLTEAHCRRLAEEGEALADPVERLRHYIVGTVSALGPGSGGARFMTSQHWRLHQEFPDELAAATKPFADLIHTTLLEGQEAGVLHPRDAELDAWLINKLVISVFHHFAYSDDAAAANDAVEGLWSFCLTAVGGVDRSARPQGATGKPTG